MDGPPQALRWDRQHVGDPALRGTDAPRATLAWPEPGESRLGKVHWRNAVGLLLALLLLVLLLGGGAFYLTENILLVLLVVLVISALGGIGTRSRWYR